jgi:hypothetical protein
MRDYRASIAMQIICLLHAWHKFWKRQHLFHSKSLLYLYAFSDVCFLSLFNIVMFSVTCERCLLKLFSIKWVHGDYHIKLVWVPIDNEMRILVGCWGCNNICFLCV